jgi:hypothetical protein
MRARLVLRHLPDGRVQLHHNQTGVWMDKHLCDSKVLRLLVPTETHFFPMEAENDKRKLLP